MKDKVVPMLHVPNVRAAVDWYQNIGFTVLDTYGDDGDGLSFAILSFGSSQIMFNEGGEPSTRFRREVDLYVYTEKVDDLHEKLKGRVEIVEAPHDTFYGMREFIIRDLNRFWITFGQPSSFRMLMTGVSESNLDLVRVALESRNIKPASLTAALVIATEDNKSSQITELLKAAGAVLPPHVEDEVLRCYAGKYKSDQGFEINVSFENERLSAAPGAQRPLTLMALNRHTFRPIAFDNYGTITFNVEGGETTSCVLQHGSIKTLMKRT